ncbi:hypothetical protein [Mesorhizobium sp. 113-3-3]|uniref:hypothetical protein n=1 Tax=Mesorhizobium sp. 113-3-3 TaxID=2744516 RepID=UPI0019282150|nr:hypothetical protein [Mesorhizobium sp. 113-3-3]BCG82307.1 hypothetical protein MesoLj113b_58490 [Mesorhizobium sp. 113-3-3]
MKITDLTPDIFDGRVNFNFDMPNGVEVSVWSLRSERQFDADPFPNHKAFNILKYVHRQIGGHFYLIVCGNDLSPRSQFRSKKGIKLSKGIKNSPHIDFEREDKSIEITRLCSIFLIDDLQYDDNDDALTNFVSSCIVFFDGDIESLHESVKEWPSIDESVWYIDYSEVAKAVSLDKRILVLRYFHADNRRTEKILAIYKSGFDIDRIRNSIVSSGIFW